MIASNWTESNINTLKQLWEKGVSSKHIAGQLGREFTRNAVISKANRLNLSSRARPKAHKTASTAPKTKEPSFIAYLSTPLPSLRSSKFLPSLLLDNAKNGRTTIMDLNNKTCRWPIGDSLDEDFCFCGHEPRTGSSYCDHHARIAYSPKSELNLFRQNYSNK